MSYIITCKDTEVIIKLFHTYHEACIIEYIGAFKREQSLYGGLKGCDLS